MDLRLDNLQSRIEKFVEEKLEKFPLNENITDDEIRAAQIPDVPQYLADIKIPALLYHLKFIVIFCLTGTEFRQADLRKPTSDRLVKKASLTNLLWLYNYFMQRGTPSLLPTLLKNYLRAKRGIVLTQGTFKMVEHENLGVMILGFITFKFPEIMKNGAKNMGNVCKVLKEYMLPEAEWKRKVSRMLMKNLNSEQPAVKIRVRGRFFVVQNDDTELGLESMLLNLKPK